MNAYIKTFESTKVSRMKELNYLYAQTVIDEKKKLEILKDKLKPLEINGRYFYNDKRYRDPVREAKDQWYASLKNKANRQATRNSYEASVIAANKSLTASSAKKATISTKSLEVASVALQLDRFLKNNVKGVKTSVAGGGKNLKFENFVATPKVQPTQEKVKTISGYFKDELGDGSFEILKKLYNFFNLSTENGEYDGSANQQLALKVQYDEYKESVIGSDNLNFAASGWEKVLPNVTDQYIGQLKNSLTVGILKWFKNILPNNIWDLKNQSKANNGYKGVRHINIANNFVRTDLTGNILFAYAGKSLGIPQFLLLGGAGFAQFLSDLINTKNVTITSLFLKTLFLGGFGTIEELLESLEINEVQWENWKTFFDDPADQEQIKLGIYLWDTYGENIDSEKINSAISLFNTNYLTQWVS